MNAGHSHGETIELAGDLSKIHVPTYQMEPGLYRAITGADAMAYGLATAAELSNRQLVLASYPITPSSNILHKLANMKELGVVTFQAEDEIAAVGAALGASYAGALGVTASSGPGVALKMEMIGSGGCDRAATDHHQFSASWSKHRPAHQDRAVRSLPVRIWTKRRRAPAGAGSTLAWRQFLLRH